MAALFFYAQPHKKYAAKSMSGKRAKLQDFHGGVFSQQAVY